MKTNDIFDLKRFGKYVLTDGKSCINRFGLDVLTMSLAGLVFYLFIGLVHMFGQLPLYHYNHINSIVLMVVMFMCIVLMFGSKCYGYVTDKRAGGLYTMMPASALEKTLSILVWSFLTPLAFFTIYLAVDGLIALVDPHYGSSLISLVLSTKDELGMLTEEMVEEGINLNFLYNPLTYIDDVMNAVLLFVLGALCFKKNKVAMTILTLIVVGMVSSFVMAPILLAGLDPNEFLQTQMPFVLEHLLLFDTLSDLLGMVGLSVAIYFRLKTIKY